MHHWCDYDGQLFIPLSILNIADPFWTSFYCSEITYLQRTLRRRFRSVVTGYISYKETPSKIVDLYHPI